MLLVSDWYSCQPKYPTTSATSATTNDPMITVVLDIFGSRMLRTSKMVLNSGYLPLRHYRPLRPG